MNLLPAWDYWIACDLGDKRVMSQPSPIRMSSLCTMDNCIAIGLVHYCNALSLHDSTLSMALVIGL